VEDVVPFDEVLNEYNIWVNGNDKSIQVSKALWKKLKTLSIEQERPISHIAEEILRKEIEVEE